MSVLARKARTATRLLLDQWRRRAQLLRPPHAGARPRVLMLSESEGATLRYRVSNQAEQLYLQEIACICADPRYLALPRLLRQCDILLLHRLPVTEQLRRIIQEARAHRIIIACDTDDLTWDERLIEYCALERYYGPTELAWFRTNFASAQELLGQVDVHIASTEYLAGLLREAFHKPTFANANAIARDTLTLSEPIAARTLSRPPSRDLMIAYFSGWARAHEIDLEVALPGLIRVLADLPDARLRIVGHFDLTWLPDSLRARVETAPFVPYERLFEAISDCDINLAPIANNPQRRSKSAIKYLEAALVGVPTVASDLEPYRVIRHGETGMLAGDDEGWYTSIMALASDAVRRAQIGRAARAQVLRDETTTARAPHFAALVRQIAGGR